MRYGGLWILCILALAPGILLAISGDGRTASTPAPAGFPDNDSLLFSGGNDPHYSAGSLGNLPPVPRFYRDALPAAIDRQWIDVSWNNENNPRTVVIYSPETTLGPFRNMDNGVADRRIFLEISSGTNLTPGPWYYQVRAGRTPSGGNETFRIYRNTGDDGA